MNNATPEPNLVPDPWALRKEANGHRKARRYAEALQPYTALWSQEDARDVWDGWGYAFCLDKTNRTREALEVCRAAYRLEPAHQPIRQLYARCIYHLELKNADGDVDLMQRAAKGVCQLVRQDDEYAPYVIPGVLTVAGELKRRGRYDDVLTWLDRLDASGLSTQPYEFEQNGRTKRGPSDAQRYWSLRCKALYETGTHDACRKAVGDALRVVPSFVNDGEVWLLRLSALARAADGEAAAAYKELAALLKKKRVWFIEYDLAQLAYDLGRDDDAWRHLLSVLLDRSPLELRVGAFELASAWLEEDGERKGAAQHLAVALGIRTAQHWPIKGVLEARAKALSASPVPSLRAAIHELTPEWQTRLNTLEPLLRGTITQVIAEGRAGFVRTEAGESYYFRSSSLRGAQPEPGLTVTFRTAPGFDRKKNQETTNAVDLNVEYNS